MNIIQLHDLHYLIGGKSGRRVHEEFSDLLSLKIREHNVEVVVIAGDIATTRQSDLEKFFSLYRPKISCPILIVFGNHDYWDADPPYPLKNPRMYGELRSYHDELLKKYNVHYLENGSYRIGNILFNGYDGWYRSSNPGTNDLSATKDRSMGESKTERRMRGDIEGVPTHIYLGSRAHKQCERVLSAADPSLVNICVSHFDATITGKFRDNGDGHDNHRGDHNHLKALSEVYDFIFYGHTHRHIDERFGKARVLCAGGGYNDPAGIVVSIPESPDQHDPNESPIIESFKLPWTKRMFGDD